MTTERVIVYIDGYNLYYGIMAARLHKSRWLDLRAMCQSLLKPNQQLALVRYFTTRVHNSSPTAQRQAIFIDALRVRGGIEIDFGYFLLTTVKCYKCRHEWEKPEEKKTDVNIAVRLLEDAYDDLFDTAILISGDSDLVPPIQSIRTRFPDKRSIVASPPKRATKELRQAADSAITLWESTIRVNRLPNPVVTSTGVELWAPEGWLPNSPISPMGSRHRPAPMTRSEFETTRRRLRDTDDAEHRL